MKILMHLKYYFSLEAKTLELETEINQLKYINQKLKNDFVESRKQEKIIVVFLLQERSLLSVFDSVIKQLSRNDKFECFIIITPQYFCGEWNQNSYIELKKHFQTNNIEAVDGIVSLSAAGKIENVIELRDLKPHYVFYTCPYMEDYHQLHRCDYVDNFAHVCYIPYGFLLAEQPETQYHQEIHRLAYRVYCETDFHKENYGLRRDQSSRVITTGYTKFDLLHELYQSEALSRIKSDFRKILIIAPHWSVADISSITRYGTFEKYCHVIEALIKKFNDIYFVFKPHPSLKSALSRKGILSLEKYEKLIQSWSQYRNFEFYAGADYFDYFTASDALITDSVSFLAEYVLFDKPLLLLSREDRSPYNKIGNLLLDGFYKAYREEDIGNFIEEVVLNGKDRLYQRRVCLKNVVKPFRDKAASLIEEDLLEITSKRYL